MKVLVKLCSAQPDLRIHGSHMQLVLHSNKLAHILTHLVTTP